MSPNQKQKSRPRLTNQFHGRAANEPARYKLIALCPNFTWHFRVGVSQLEAGFLSRQTGAGQVSGPLCHTAEYGGGQLHLSSIGEGNDHPEMDRSNTRRLPLQRKGPPGHNSSQAAEEHRGIPSTLFADSRTTRPGGQHRANPVSAAAEL